MATTNSKGKAAAAHLTNIVETLREIAWTEVGETDDRTVHRVCRGLLVFAGQLDGTILDLKKGAIPDRQEDDDLPF